MPQLRVATYNAHKTEEIRAMLGSGFEVTDLSTYREALPPDETGATFEENAIIKALAASRVCGGLVLSDDSGLEVDALGGAPGVRSARYAGENATDAENRTKLLRALSAVGVRGRKRSARFRCVMALAERGDLLGTFEGSVEGIIGNRERGTGGFGYDSLFVPSGFCETFAQLARKEKNDLSHRAQAMRKVRTFLAFSD